MIVVDASAMIALTTADARVAAPLADRIEPEPVGVPHLFDVEIVHALRRATARRRISLAKARAVVDELLGFRATRYPHRALVHRMFDLRDNLSAYDAAYVALAEALDCPLVTCDARLARAPGHAAAIEVFPPR